MLPPETAPVKGNTLLLQVATKLVREERPVVTVTVPEEKALVPKATLVPFVAGAPLLMAASAW